MYTIEATFVDYNDGNVRLRKQNGSMVSVPLSKLRLADQQFVAKQMMLQAKISNAEAIKAEPAPASDTPKAAPATSSAASKAPPAAAEAPPAAVDGPEAMFEVVKTEIVAKPVEVNNCRVTPKSGSVLFVCTVNFTKAGMALSPEALAKLKIAKASIKLSKNSKQGNVISKGDFALRLDDDRTVPCHCLPATDTASGLPVRPPRVRGGDNWLMYCGNVRLLASVKPDVKPEALVWGGTYEAKIPSSTGEPAKQPAMAAVAQATPPPKAAPAPTPAPTPAPAPAAAPAKAAPSNSRPAVARETDAARRERIARRMAVLNNGVLRDLAAKYPQLASTNFGPQLADTNEFWNDKDEFNQAAFDAFIKRMMGGK
jgi:hypothetical protein